MVNYSRAKTATIRGRDARTGRSCNDGLGFGWIHSFCPELEELSSELKVEPGPTKGWKKAGALPVVAVVSNRIRSEATSAMQLWLSKPVPIYDGETASQWVNVKAEEQPTKRINNDETLCQEQTTINNNEAPLDAPVQEGSVDEYTTGSMDYNDDDDVYSEDPDFDS